MINEFQLYLHHESEGRNGGTSRWYSDDQIEGKIRSLIHQRPHYVWSEVETFERIGGYKDNYKFSVRRWVGTPERGEKLILIVETIIDDNVNG